MHDTLKGRAVIITGAGSGIGRATAWTLGAAGCRLMLADINPDALESAAAELAASGVAEEHIARTAIDVQREPDAQRMADETLSRYGTVDALVACAGILRTGKKLRTIADTPTEEWDAVVGVNLTGTFLCNRAVLPAMMERKQGDIINISSTSGRQGRAFDGPYSASKFGIVGLSEALAEEVWRHGIRVQTVLPDAVSTPLWDQNGPAALKPPQSLPPARVAEFIAYLLALPRDTMLMNPVLMPFRARRGRKKD